MITVRFFGSLHDEVGCERLEIQASSNPADIEGLLRSLAARMAQDVYAALTDASVRIAVNQSLIEGNQMLAEGDEVAFLPPVTGG